VGLSTRGGDIRTTSLYIRSSASSDRLLLAFRISHLFEKPIEFSNGIGCSNTARPRIRWSSAQVNHSEGVTNAVPLMTAHVAIPSGNHASG
jgi:hypothetical protein